MNVINLRLVITQDKQIRTFVQCLSGNEAENEICNIPISEMPGICIEDEYAPYLPTSYTRRKKVLPDGRHT